MQPPLDLETKIRTADMPAAMRALLEQYPRNDWESHPGFKESTKNWLGAHLMFRQLGEILRSDTENYLDAGSDPRHYARRLGAYGDALVRNLHGHHHFEDHSYFPELKAADPRFEAGLEILEKDHESLDAVLDQFVRHANRTIQLIQLDPQQAQAAAGKVHATSQTIEAFLNRHLSDEEELAVPIILHHRLRG